MLILFGKKATTDGKLLDLMSKMSENKSSTLRGKTLFQFDAFDPKLFCCKVHCIMRSSPAQNV